MRRSAYIFLLAILFYGAAAGLDAVDFWGVVGLPEPHGYKAQGFIFLALLFVLQNTLFEPYVRVLEERQAETVGKKAKAEEARLKAEEMLAKYRLSIREARAKAAREREEREIAAEEEERQLLRVAKEKANAEFRDRVAAISKEADGVRGELVTSIEPLATDILTQVLKDSPSGRRLRLVGGANKSL